MLLLFFCACCNAIATISKCASPQTMHSPHSLLFKFKGGEFFLILKMTQEQFINYHHIMAYCFWLFGGFVCRASFDFSAANAQRQYLSI